VRPPPSAQGWPFLIGAGRRRDYSTLLAPDFLVVRREHGLLNEVVGPTPGNSSPRVTEATTPTGQRLGIAYATHLVTAADVADPRDEHSRPLRLIYGFVCPDGRIAEPAAADLAAAHTAALDVYRRFLANEDRFTAVPSAAFPLQSTVTAVAVSDPARPRQPTGATPTPSRQAVWGWGAAIVAVVVATVLLIVNVGGEPGRDNSPTPSPSVTTATRSPG
jgi:hypothetical protein